MTLCALFAVLLASQVRGPDTEAPAKDSEQTRAQRLEFMKNAAESYNISLTTNRKQKLRLLKKPLLRYADQVTHVPDATLFVWTHDGRPEATVCIWLHPKGIWFHEFQSLSRTTLVAEQGGTRKWYPSKPGVEFKRMPDAPAPAEKKGGRLRQMRNLARQFTASVNDPKYGRQQLRLMPQPLHRYGKAGGDVLDGGLFAFSKGTNPEVLLLIEALPDKAGKLHWHYAPARMSSRECEIRRQNKVVWRIPFSPRQTRDEPYFNVVLR